MSRDVTAMPRAADRIRRVAVVGAGTIGTSWAGYFSGKGLDVVVVEPDDAARGRVVEAVAQCHRAMAAAGLRDPAAPAGQLAVVADIPALAGQAIDFVQENVREQLAVKQTTLRALDALLPADVVIASSTSGLAASELQDGCAHPQRVLVGHPMNPPHLLPLVEIVGGRATAPAAVQAAADFYEAIGKRPVTLNKEVIGHLATRLTVALWREAACLVRDGVASVADVDAAVTHGLGLRLAVAGPHLSYHLGGGEGGLAGFFAWAREPLRQWCADLGTLDLDAGLEAKLVAGVTAATEGHSVAALSQRRDAALARLLAQVHGKTASEP
ncbi:MAG: 3-hydroxyacyl-CoA dehydrogenase NAD-binding domain-containing protein [Pseudomonadota bacterium]|jgi:3-hydroxyacyl-CoA dehydrogenase